MVVLFCSPFGLLQVSFDLSHQLLSARFVHLVLHDEAIAAGLAYRRHVVHQLNAGRNN